MHTILLVDDSKTNLQMIRGVLSETYNVLPAVSGEIALRYAERKKIDLVLLDLCMPEMDGRQTLQALRRIPACASVPIVFLTAETTPQSEVECLKLGACDFIAKPVVAEILLTRLERILELEMYRKDLQGHLQEKTIELENVFLQAVAAIANALDARDEYTKGHSVRVAHYSAALAAKKQWSPEDCATVYSIALLHDVGKIGTPDALLKKEGPLTDEEFSVLQQHTLIGANILKDIVSPYGLSIGACSHHERYDGTGYPRGLKGCEIPELARIISIADAYDAMTSDRCYRKCLSPEMARANLIEGAGSQFDPELVRLFVEMLDAGFCIKKKGKQSSCACLRAASPLR